MHAPDAWAWLAVVAGVLAADEGEGCTHGGERDVGSADEWLLLPWMTAAFTPAPRWRRSALAEISHARASSTQRTSSTTSTRSSPRASRGRQVGRAVSRPYPVLMIAVLDQICANGRVVSRWELRGTHRGRRVTLHGIAISRFEEDKIAEDWTVSDNLDCFAACAYGVYWRLRRISPHGGCRAEQPVRGACKGPVSLNDRLRLAELLSGLSSSRISAWGLPPEDAMRSCLVCTALAREIELAVTLCLAAPAHRLH
jgi:hypothetical protein